MNKEYVLDHVECVNIGTRYRVTLFWRNNLRVVEGTQIYYISYHLLGRLYNFLVSDVYCNQIKCFKPARIMGIDYLSVREEVSTFLNGDTFAEQTLNKFGY